jgi:RHS repeat-associated protein
MACNSTTALGVSWGQWSGTVPGATVTYDYDAFGNKVNSTGTTPNNFLYIGEQWDSDLSLYYLRARYLNPLTGRFVSRDPEDGINTDPKTLHKYIYASGDPVNLADPTGRRAATASAGGFEYAGLVLDIGISSVVAVDAYLCAVNVAYAMDALNVAGYTDVMPNWFFCSARGKRVSCRYNVNIHIIGTSNHDSIGPFVGNATGRSCSETCSVAQAEAYAQATLAAAGRPYHIIHEKQYCRE